MQNADGRVAITTSTFSCHLSCCSQSGVQDIKIQNRGKVEGDESQAKKRKKYELRARTNANL